ncbi:MAG: hypothetical protein DHS20C01_34930 [marine bacterium B5-7]|nr:MAG: hypothetical protein DHS20C01_34930 [marine bacterium B5-7]
MLATAAISANRNAMPDDTLTRDIEALVLKIRSSENDRDDAMSAVESTEREILEVRRERDAADASIADLNRQIDELDRQNDAAAARLPGLIDQLGDWLRVRQRLTRRSRASILLGESNPARTQRLLHYYDTLLELENERIDFLNAQIDTILKVKDNLTERHAEIDAARQVLSQRENKFQQLRQRRQQQVAALRDSLNQSRQQLEEKRRAKARLDTLVEGIGTLREKRELETSAPAQTSFGQTPDRSGDITNTTVTGTSATTTSAAIADEIILNGLQDRKGSLHLPADGTITTRFGQPDKLSGVPSGGIIIETPEGADVRSISSGQVVYSDWFRGFGLLLVLDHGDGFMSLYGHNSELLYPTGALVGENTPVARAGDTSGRRNVGVYFEIRHRGEAVDPLAWCTTKRG